MRIGVSTASFFNKVLTESSFDMLRSMRVDITEVYLNSFCEYEKPFIDALASRKGNINVHAIHPVATQFEPELYSSNQRQRADAELFFRKVCYAGHVLGAKFYTFQGPSRLKALNYSFDYARLGERTNQLIDIAQSYGIKLSFENTHWTYFTDGEFFTNLLKYCPRLHGTYNVKNAVICGHDPIKFINTFGDRLSTVHLSDMEKRETRLPGHGKINFEKMFKVLDSHTNKIPALIEVHSRDYNDNSELCESFNKMNAKLIKIRNN